MSSDNRKKKYTGIINWYIVYLYEYFKCFLEFYLIKYIYIYIKIPWNHKLSTQILFIKSIKKKKKEKRKIPAHTLLNLYAHPFDTNRTHVIVNKLLFVRVNIGPTTFEILNIPPQSVLLGLIHGRFRFSRASSRPDANRTGPLKRSISRFLCSCC